jgi:hypothetical protein
MSEKNMWLDAEAGKEFSKNFKKNFVDTPDYRKGYRDAALGISRKVAVEAYGIQNLSIRYFMGHNTASKNMLEGAVGNRN